MLNLLVTGDQDGDLQFSSASTTSVRLTTTRPLNYEKKSFYQLSITAVNTGEADARNTTITFNITVIDVNDNGPVFTPALIQQPVAEDLAVGSHVITVTAVDPDTGAFDLMNYSIVSNLSSSYFAINKTTGQITLQKALDREQEDRYIIIVQARDPLFSSVAEIVLNVTDVNDNQPRFNPSSYSLDIVENTLVSSSLVQVFASDPDLGLNSTLVYSILDGNAAGHFAINSQNGVITLVIALDYEKTKSFTLLIGLRDMGSPLLQSSNNATVTINIVDINDNYAHFEKSLYTASLPETSSISTFVVQVKAVDGDGTSKHSNLTFSINQTLANSTFSINPVTGVITLKSSLDYEKVKEYHFSVIATDNGTVPYQRHTNVIVYVQDINDELPYFMPATYNVTVSEFSRPGAMVLHLFGYDNDTKALQYTISSQSPKGDFLIDSSSGSLYAKNGLDRENITSYTLSVSLSDGANSASTTVIVNINDENDNRPIFSQTTYIVSVPENTAVSSFIILVQASDLDIGSNSAITYSIFNSGLNDSSLFFSINSSTGAISLAKPLDYEQDRVHHFVVVANDAGAVQLRGHASVEVRVIDSNDNAPYFVPSVYSATIPEAINVDNVVMILTARDNDTSSSQLSYEIVGGNVNNDFKLHSSMSNVLVVAKSLDYETTQMYSIIVRAFDGMHYSTTNATINVNISDINDNNPIFNPSYYRVTIPENTNNSYVFLQVSATDADGSAANNRITYTSLDNTTDFNLNQNTGAITVNSIDYERKSQYSLVVIAQDNGMPWRQNRALVDIIITDINDNAPVISPVSYSINISEAALIGLQITTIKASDVDTGVNGQLVYSIVSGNNLQRFQINADTGVISINGSLDYESAEENYTLTISVQDKGGLKAASNATVFIRVFDVNDNQPVFVYNQLKCQEAATIQLTSCQFAFSRYYYEGTLPETYPTSQTFLTIQTRALTSSTIFSIIEVAARSLFQINPSTGNISLIVPLNYTQQKMHRFTVRARIGSEYSDAVVVVNVLDVNNNCPVFSQSEVYSRLTTPVESGTIIAINKANDADSAPALSYSITAGDAGDDFSIDNMGVIRTKKRVVIAGSKTFNLTLSVTDGVCTAQSKAVIIIHLDTMFTVTPSKCPVYCPVCPVCTGVPVVTTSAPTCPVTCPTCLAPSNYMFSRAQYVRTLLENTTYSSAILQVRLVSGSAAVNYSIVQASALEYFRVNRTTGEIFLVKELDFETAKRHLFNARAEFAGGVFGNVSIDIYVQDINDNHPYFITATYAVQIHEYTISGATIVHVLAGDRDTVSTLTMAIDSGNTNSLFTINPSNGVITLAASPYLYTQNTYTLRISLADNGGLQADIQATVTVTIVRITAAKAGCKLFGVSSYITRTLAENVAVGTTVVSLTGTPVSSNRSIVYSIGNPEGNAYFQINATGVITTKVSLDYEKMTSHIIVVNAQDQVTGITSIAFVVVNVTDVNDNSLVVTGPSRVTVSELASSGSYVTTIRATDNDAGTNISYSITSGNANGLFFIDPVTGIITLNQRLNHDSAQSHSLTACARDSNTGSQACHSFTIAVRNENNKQTVFASKVYTASVPLNTSIGTIVTTISATDPDGMGAVKYSLDGAVANEYFDVNVTTGVVTLKKSLSGAGLSLPIVITACATDAANPATTSCVPVVFDTGSSVIIQPNNYRPYFIHQSYSAVINENATLGSIVLIIAAADNDTGASGVIHYNQLQGANADYFAVDGRTGIITNVKSLNTSSAPKVFFLTVTARDHGTPAKTSLLAANITIAVLHPQYNNNSITTVTALTMQISLTKDPFEDSMIIKYEVVAQQYEASATNFNELTGMHTVSWYHVHYIPDTFRYRRYVIATIIKTNSKRKRRAIQKTSSRVDVDVGTEKNCQTKTLESDVCNGPLLPGKFYRFQLVGYYVNNQPVSGAFTEPKATTLASISTKTGVGNSAYVATYWIIGLVVLSFMFLMALLVIVIIFCFKRKYRKMFILVVFIFCF
ncbi:protocadherin Fat 4-like isoform X2 [Rhopilema esculentum]|uniref:protocadherin Fat 4-like isoform X2 n=1 Tax=Rhopilema esculentum TaxID=499914 RepID=UPI0031D60085